MDKSREIGIRGEQIAHDYLLSLNYRIVERNFRTGHLEIDIIAERNGTLYFVEVKTRTCDERSVRQFMPEAAMDGKKRDKIYRAVDRYLDHREFDGEVSVELIAVNISAGEYSLRHYTAVQWM